MMGVKAMNTTMHIAARVVNELIAHFGEGRIGCVQKLNGSCFRVELRTGEIALAVVEEDGNVRIKIPGVMP